LRNNEQRTGPGPRSDDSAPEASSSNELFNFSTPTEFVELPSQGKYYPEGHVLHNVGEVEIRYMTAKDEDILSSKTLLQKGIAVERFLQNIIVDKNIKTEDFLIGDKNAVTIAARITGYGEEYDVNVTCPSCGTSNPRAIDLSDLNIYHGDNYEDAGFQKTGIDTFVINTPVSKVDVEVRLMTGRDEAYLATVAENRRKKKLPETTLTDQFSKMIASVNGNSQNSVIKSFIEHMPARDSRFLREVYQKVVPNIDLTQHFICESCNFEQDMEVPFTVDFFWPRR
jgi:hypothetical protein